MNVKRTAYVLLAVAKGHRTTQELVAATSLPKEAIDRALRDHAKKLNVRLSRERIGEETHYTLEHWGMLDANWLWPNERTLTEELGLPVLDTHPRNVLSLP